MSDRRGAVALGLTLFVLGATPLPARSEPRVAILPLDFAAVEFRSPGSRLASVASTSDALRGERLPPGEPLVVVWGADRGAALRLVGRDLRVLPLGAGAPDLAAREAPKGAIPQSRLASSGALTAYLSEPSAIYAHGVLGDATEAASLTIIERGTLQPSAEPKPVPTTTVRVPAGSGAVFEDLEPRLADLDRDGTPEILVVRSTVEKGSSLAVVGKRDGTWRIVAETPPAGEPNRWLNPAGIADFDGDGSPDIAIVRTPHRDGVLQVWSFSGDRLALKHEAAGYANHALGSTALDLAAMIDIDGDGRPELALPTLDRTALAILSLRGGVRELQRIPLPSRAKTGVAALGKGKDARLIVGLEDGRVADVTP